MYHGQDISNYAPGKERRQQKNYLDEKEYKLNWHTLELVHKKKRRPKDNPAPYISETCDRTVHWLGTSKVLGKDEHFLVSFDMIPENFRDDPGELFTKEFLTSVNYNEPVEVEEDVRERFKRQYELLENTVISKVRLKIDKKTKKKSWEAQALDHANYKQFITESWLRENIEKQYPEYFYKMMTVKDVWHQVPVGAKKEMPNLQKKEEDEVVNIYVPDEFKCAFANLANALYAIHDYAGAEFFERHMNSDYKTLSNLLDDNGTKAAMNQFMLAVRLLQHKHGYKVMKLKKTDDLLRPPKLGTIKYVTLMGSFDDHKHVISIVRNLIFDSSNKKILTLCRESIAWCCSKSVERLKQAGRTIDCGYLLSPPKRMNEILSRRRQHEFVEGIEGDGLVKKFKKRKIAKLPK